MSRTSGSVLTANFELDLNAARLPEKLAKYVDHDTRVTPQRTGQTRRGVKPAVSDGGAGGPGVGPAERPPGYWGLL